MERIDKVLSNMGLGSRRDIKKNISHVMVNGKICRDPGLKVDPNVDCIKYRGEDVLYRQYIYLMMNKPMGYITAVEDNYQSTIMELIDEIYIKMGVYPVGRLDKDTEGFIILTNNGEIAHRIMSPKSNCVKKYYIRAEGILTAEHIEAVHNGITLGSGVVFKPAVLEILGHSGNESEAILHISEGKYHQVKRMIAALGCEVIYLKRLSIAGINLDSTLETGEYREMLGEELDILLNI